MASLVLYNQNDKQHSASETFGDLGLRLLWPECIPHTVPDGGRAYLVFGAPTTVAAILPSHCDEIGMLTNLLGFSPLWLFASLLSVVVEVQPHPANTCPRPIEPLLNLSHARRSAS